MNISKLNKLLTTLTAFTLTLTALLTTPFLTVASSLGKHVVVYPLIAIITFALVVKFIVARRISFIWSRSDLLLVLFSILIYASYISAGNNLIAFYGTYARFFGAATLLTFITWYFIARQTLVADPSVDRYLRWMNGALFAASLYGILQYFGLDIFTYKGVAFSGHGAFSTFGNPNNFAGFLVLLLPLPFALYLKNTKDKYFYLLSFLLGSGALMLTFTRGSWIAAFFSLTLLVYFAFGNKEARTDIIRILGLLAAIIVLIIAFTAGSGSEVTDAGKRLTSIVKFDGSINERLDVYKIGMLSLDDKPLFGYGPDHFAYAFDLNQTRDFVDQTNELAKFDNAHNYFLQLGVTLGLPAVLVFILFIVIRLYKALVSLLKVRAEGRSDHITLAAFIACVGYVGHLKFEVEDVASLLIFFTMLAVLANRTDSRNVSSYDPQADKGIQGTLKGAILGASLIPVLACCYYFGAAYYQYMVTDSLYLQAKKAEAIGDQVTTEKYLSLAKSRFGNNSYYFSRSGHYYYDKSFELDNVDLAYKGMTDFERAASLDSLDADIRLSLGKSYMDISDFDPDFKRAKAENEFKQTIVLSPNYRSAHILLAIIYIQTEQPKKAIEPLENAREIDPDFKPTYYYLGIANQKLGNNELAKENLLKAAGDPDYEAQVNAALKELEEQSGKP